MCEKCNYFMLIREDKRRQLIVSNLVICKCMQACVAAKQAKLASSMAPNATLSAFSPCTSKATIGMVVIILQALVPQLFLLHILSNRLTNPFPRHLILKSLLISDMTFLVVGGLSFAVGVVASFSSVNIGCKIIRRTVLFAAMIVLYGTSGAVIGLSLERFFACKYCLWVHMIVTEKRVKLYLMMIWFLAILFATVVASVSEVSDSTHPDTLYSLSIVINILLTCSVLTGIQSYIFTIFRRKIRVTPHGQFGVQAEKSHMFKRQLKLTISMGAIALTYVICELPLAASYINNLLYGERFESKVHQMLSILATFNTFVDPFIYGFGMADVRKEIKREFKVYRTWFVARFM